MSHASPLPSQRCDPPLPLSGKAERQQQGLSVCLQTQPPCYLEIAEVRKQSTPLPSHPQGGNAVTRGLLQRVAQNLQAGWPGPDHHSEGSHRARGRLGCGQGPACQGAGTQERKQKVRACTPRRETQHESEEERRELRDREKQNKRGREGDSQENSERRRKAHRERQTDVNTDSMRGMRRHEARNEGNWKRT